MSDGPYRSLNMRPAWKKVAKFADMDASAPEDVSNAVIGAFAQDWAAGVAEPVARCICDVLGGWKDSLFQDQKVMQLEALRPMTAGHELSQLLVDCAIRRASSDRSGTDTAVEATADALAIWGARHGRQIEEHFYRKSTVQRAHNIRSRIEGGIGQTSLNGLARQFLNLEPKMVKHTPPKQSGLDDGVPL